MTTIGGYRVVRTLGTGSHAGVVLGHPLAGGGQVALKVPHSSDRERAFRELDALDAAAGPHVVRLLDACTDARGIPVGILELLPPTSLAALLARRGSVSRGEAVGVIATLARTLDRIHAAGVTHGAITADNILIDPHGEPVLVGFGSSLSRGDRPTLAARDEDPETQNDCAGLLRLAEGLFDLAGVTDLLAGGQAHGLVSAELIDFATRLDLAARTEPLASAPTAPQRVPTALPPSTVPTPAKPLRGRRRATRPPFRHHVGTLARQVIRDLSESTRRVRPRFWVLGAGALVALVAALVIVPGRSTDAVTTGPAARATSAETASRPAAGSTTPGAGAERTASEPGSGAVTSGTVSDDPSEDSPPHASAPTAGEDDVVVALRELLERRDRCIRGRSVTCLSDVSQSGSAARRDDEALIQALRQGAAPSDQLSGSSTPQIELIDEYGGAALLRVVRGDTATPVLIMKTGVGWRIRAYPAG